MDWTKWLVVITKNKTWGPKLSWPKISTLSSRGHRKTNFHLSRLILRLANLTNYQLIDTQMVLWSRSRIAVCWLLICISWLQTVDRRTTALIWTRCHEENKYQKYRIHRSQRQPRQLSWTVSLIYYKHYKWLMMWNRKMGLHRLTGAKPIRLHKESLSNQIQVLRVVVNTSIQKSEITVWHQPI